MSSTGKAAGKPMNENEREALLRREALEAFRRLVSLLPEQQGVVLRLYCAGRTQKEIAGCLGVAPATVHRRLRAARATLRELLPRDEELLASPDAGLPPELREWALRQVGEEELAAGLRELREQGGLELRDFVHELDQIVARP